MKAFIPAIAVTLIAAASSVSYAPVAHARQFCPTLLKGCSVANQAVCEARYEACVEAGGDPGVKPVFLDARED